MLLGSSDQMRQVNYYSVCHTYGLNIFSCLNLISIALYDILHHVFRFTYAQINKENHYHIAQTSWISLNCMTFEKENRSVHHAHFWHCLQDTSWTHTHLISTKLVIWLLWFYQFYISLSLLKMMTALVNMNKLYLKMSTKCNKLYIEQCQNVTSTWNEHWLKNSKPHFQIVLKVIKFSNIYTSDKQCKWKTDKITCWPEQLFLSMKLCLYLWICCLC